MDNEDLHIEDLSNRQDLFHAPRGYFDKLPLKVAEEIHRPAPVAVPWKKWIWMPATACAIMLAWIGTSRLQPETEGTKAFRVEIGEQKIRMPEKENVSPVLVADQGTTDKKIKPSLKKPLQSKEDLIIEYLWEEDEIDLLEATAIQKITPDHESSLMENMLDEELDEFEMFGGI